MILVFMGPPRGWALKKLPPFILKINENYDVVPLTLVSLTLVKGTQRHPFYLQILFEAR